MLEQNFFKTSSVNSLHIYAEIKKQTSYNIKTMFFQLQWVTMILTFSIRHQETRLRLTCWWFEQSNVQFKQLFVFLLQDVKLPPPPTVCVTTVTRFFYCLYHPAALKLKEEVQSAWVHTGFNIAERTAANIMHSFAPRCNLNHYN